MVGCIQTHCPTRYSNYSQVEDFGRNLIIWFTNDPSHGPAGIQLWPQFYAAYVLLLYVPWDQWLSGKSIWLVSSVPSWSQFFSVDSLFLVQNVPTGFQQLLACFTWLHKSRQSVLCHHGGDISPSSTLLPFCSSRNREHWRHEPKIVRCHMTSLLLLDGNNLVSATVKGR